MKRVTYLILGHLFLVIGFIGAFLPVLPTTPFLLLSAFFYSKSSERLHNWMLNHKMLGPPLRDWQDNGVIGPKAKALAAIMLLFVILYRIPTLNINLWIKVVAEVVLVIVFIFILTRPSKRKKPDSSEL